MSEISTVAFEKVEQASRWDAEHFAPRYMRHNAVMSLLNCRRLGDLAAVSDGNHISMSNRFTNKGIRYLRGQDLTDFFIADEAPIYIPDTDYMALSRSHMHVGDVLIGIVGTIGSIGLVTERFEKLTGNCKLAIVRSEQIEPEYIAAYLASDVGQNEIVRRTRGAVQMGVVLPDVRDILVPILSEDIRQQIVTLVKTAYKYRQDAAMLYPEAEAELLERMGWAKSTKREAELHYIEKFSTAHEHERIDAEYFHPQYWRLYSLLEKANSQRIASVCNFVKHGVQPPYVTNGTIPIITQRQFTSTHLDLTTVDLWTSESFTEENQNFVLRKGDVLTYCVSAGDYLGRTNIYLEDSPAVAASFVTILRTALLNPIYLALFLNSPAGTLQGNSMKRGTSPFYLYPRDLSKVLVYIPRNGNGAVDSEWQAKLAAKVNTAREAKVEATARLAKAKRMVEDAILTAA